MANEAVVSIWGTDVGAILWDDNTRTGIFEYMPAFLNAPVELSPIHLPRRPGIFQFTGLNRETYRGLPGMFADALPDKFGNALIDRWLAETGRQQMNPVERLLYVGNRAMGALEFNPAINKGTVKDSPLDIEKLVRLSSRILSERQQFQTRIDTDNGTDNSDGLNDILMVGTSAGGARAKAVIAWNETTHEVRSGQTELRPDFEHYLIKFDGVSNNRDKERLADPQGFGRLEMAYHLMAIECGIQMMPCRLLEEGARAHFMTQRFDRQRGQKLHMQSLCGLAHYDFNLPGAYGYEQVFKIILKLLQRDAQPALEQQFLRAVFNVVGRNQDDHTKNIAFLMNRQGQWSLSPAFDLTFAYNPNGQFTSGHQITIGGKRGVDGQDEITREDLIALGKQANLSRLKAVRIIDRVVAVFNQFEVFADSAGVDAYMQSEVKRCQRLAL